MSEPPSKIKSPLHRAALAYAAQGIPVFPCLPGCKEPAIKGSFHAASADAEIIGAWWTENPNYNLALCPEDAGWCVIDIDVAEIPAELAGLPETRTVFTPGGGRHLYYEGSLRTSAKQLAPGIDTRGRLGYVLVPPSMVDGRPYKLTSEAEIAPLPAWIAERLPTRARPPLTAPGGFEPNPSHMVDLARAELRAMVQRGDVAIEGQGGDDRTYRAAARMRDLGLDEQGARDAIAEEWNPHCEPPWSDDELAEKVGNAYRYGQNEIGSRALPDPAVWEVEQYASAPVEPTVEPPPYSVDAGSTPNRFRGRWPDEYDTMPELAFWDADKMLPKSPDGCIAILYGDFGTGKTNATLTMVLDAVLRGGARACYAAGEGAYGVGKDRIPAHCKARGITTQDLRGKFRVVPAVPLFSSPEDVAAFIEAQRDMGPSIIVLDTLATAIAGEDENSSKAAAFLTANGPAGRIRDAYKALVILPAHSGKDASKGVRGNSGFGGNADVILHLETDKDVGAIKLTVEKMRDGRDEHCAYFKYEPGGGVPVPRKISAAEYMELVKGSPDGGTITPKMVFSRRRSVLAASELFSFSAGWTGRQFAEKLIGPPPPVDDVDAMAVWQTAVGKEEKSLKNARNTKAYEGVLCNQQVAPGGSALQWRWFVMQPGG